MPDDGRVACRQAVPDPSRGTIIRLVIGIAATLVEVALDLLCFARVRCLNTGYEGFPRVIPDQSAAFFKGFLETSQALAKTYMEFVAKQQAALSTPGAAAPVPSMPMSVPDWEPFANLQRDLATQHMQLWQAMMQRKPGAPAEAVVRPEPGDRRFSAPEWGELPAYDYLRQAYLLNATFLTKLAEAMPIADGAAKTRMQFLTRLFVEGMAPSNFALTNPEFLKAALETKGESITAGLKNMLEDLQKGRVSMTDETAFEIGRNIATTPGAVIYENDLIQLIQYTPVTDKVAERPILLVPPCMLSPSEN